MISNSKFRLNSGNDISHLGLGVYQLPAGETFMRLVDYALKIGYRHIDTAKLYDNEQYIGRAVMKRGFRREEIFITTKVWNYDQGYDSTIRALEGSFKPRHDFC